ncbi:acid phosphatase type 7-like [Ylistrum balloti]|uniref:acid phosphatase type 7-like n=1 Tax=Ylistrum balloti TaxID=509963 RepID=UPI002905F434|nr:acid phosphatase type 7-like [Ylistrum balloti]
MKLERPAVLIHLMTVLFLVSSFSSVFCAYADPVRQMDSQDSVIFQMKRQTDDTLPRQIHIAFGVDPTDITIMWATEKEDQSIVQFNPQNRPGSTVSVEGKSVVFENNTKGWKYLHRVALQGLIPGCLYFYNVGGDIQSQRSNFFSFRVPFKYEPHTYMVFGDLGTKSANLQFLVHESRARNYSAIFHVGDIAYDLGSDGGKVGDKFLNLIQLMSANTPYMTVPGDHDLFKDDEYRYRFSNPNADWPMQMEQLWYSINMGKTHFVCISTEVFFSDERNVERFMKWLQHDLTKANDNRSNFPWIVVMAHRPMYCSVDDTREDCRKPDSVVRQNLESVYSQFGVDVVFSGHNHMYERTWPTYQNKAVALNYINPMAPVHIIVGSLGNQYLTEYTSKPGGGWSAFTKSGMEIEIYGRLTVYNYTHLYWEARSAMDNSLVDRMLIIQRVHGPFTNTQVNIPDPLGEAGKAWRNRNGATEDDGSLINLNFFVVYDDYNTRVTVLCFTSIILLIGVCLRKKIINFLRFCCLKNDKCNNNIT